MDDERRLAAWLDPDAPDPWGGVPSRYLTSQGYAVRLLRFIAEQQRRGRDAEALLEAVKATCRLLVTGPHLER